MGDIKNNEHAENSAEAEAVSRREVFGKLVQIHRMTRFIRHHMRGHGHGPTDPSRGQGRVLSLLKIRDGLSTRDIAEVCGIRVSSLNETLARMERDGLVERRASEQDKRIQLAYLTDAGRAVEPVSEHLPDRVLADFSEEELAQLGSYLERIAAKLEEELGEEGRELMEEMRRRRRELGLRGEPGFAGPHGNGPHGPHHRHGRCQR